MAIPEGRICLRFDSFMCVPRRSGDTRRRRGHHLEGCIHASRPSLCRGSLPRRYANSYRLLTQEAGRPFSIRSSCHKLLECAAAANRLSDMGAPAESIAWGATRVLCVRRSRFRTQRWTMQPDFQTSCEVHREFLLRIACLQLGNASESEDVVQETLV